MSRFVLTAEIKLRGPSTSEMNAISSQMKAGLSGINVPINFDIPASQQRVLKNVAADLRTVKKHAQETTDSFELMGKSLSQNIRRYGSFTIATGAFIRLGIAIRQSVGEAIDFETEIRKIAQGQNATIASFSGLKKEIDGLSKSLGVSSLGLAGTARILAQAGLSASEVKVSLEALAKSELAPTFGDINETTEASIAIFRQFGIEAVELKGILGSINKVSADFAVESEDIAVAIRLAGASFAAASPQFQKGEESFRQFISLFTSVRQTTRGSAESIATGIRTITTRLQRSGTIEYFKALGIELRDSEGQFIGAYNAIGKIASALEGIPGTDPRFANIAELLGGYRQIDKTIPLLQQMAVTEKAYQSALKGRGSLDEGVALAQETLAQGFKRVGQEFDSLVRKISENDSFRDMIGIALSLASAMIKVVDSITPLLPLLATIGITKIGFALPKIGKGFADDYKSVVGRGKKDGGPIHFALGGNVPGSGSGDKIPAMLEPGEYVIPKDAVGKHSGAFWQALREGKTPQKFATGGSVGGNFSGIDTSTLEKQMVGLFDKMLANIGSQLGDDLVKEFEKVKNEVQNRKQGESFSNLSESQRNKNTKTREYNAEQSRIDSLVFSKSVANKRKQQSSADYSDIISSSNNPFDVAQREKDEKQVRQTRGNARRQSSISQLNDEELNQLQQTYSTASKPGAKRTQGLIQNELGNRKSASTVADNFLGAQTAEKGLVKSTTDLAVNHVLLTSILGQTISQFAGQLNPTLGKLVSELTGWFSVLQAGKLAIGELSKLGQTEGIQKLLTKVPGLGKAGGFIQSTGRSLLGRGLAAGGGIAAGVGILGAATESVSNSNIVDAESKGKRASGLAISGSIGGSLLKGAGAGAAIGSIFGPIGTAAGAAAGALISMTDSITNLGRIIDEAGSTKYNSKAQEQLAKGKAGSVTLGALSGLSEKGSGGLFRSKEDKFSIGGPSTFDRIKRLTNLGGLTDFGQGKNNQERTKEALNEKGFTKESFQGLLQAIAGGDKNAYNKVFKSNEGKAIRELAKTVEVGDNEFNAAKIAFEKMANTVEKVKKTLDGAAASVATYILFLDKLNTKFDIIEAQSGLASGRSAEARSGTLQATNFSAFEDLAKKGVITSESNNILNSNPNKNVSNNAKLEIAASAISQQLLADKAKSGVLTEGSLNESQLGTSLTNDLNKLFVGATPEFKQMIENQGAEFEKAIQAKFGGSPENQVRGSEIKSFADDLKNVPKPSTEAAFRFAKILNQTTTNMANLSKEIVILSLDRIAKLSSNMQQFDETLSTVAELKGQTFNKVGATQANRAIQLGAIGTATGQPIGPSGNSLTDVARLGQLKSQAEAGLAPLIDKRSSGQALSATETNNLIGFQTQLEGATRGLKLFGEGSEQVIAALESKANELKQRREAAGSSALGYLTSDAAGKRQQRKDLSFATRLANGQVNLKDFQGNSGGVQAAKQLFGEKDTNQFLAKIPGLEGLFKPNKEEDKLHQQILLENQARKNSNDLLTQQVPLMTALNKELALAAQHFQELMTPQGQANAQQNQGPNQAIIHNGTFQHNINLNVTGINENLVNREQVKEMLQVSINNWWNQQFGKQNKVNVGPEHVGEQKKG